MSGGAFHRNSDMDPFFHSCTLADNVSTNGHFAGIYAFDQIPIILNSILWNSGSYELYYCSARVFFSDIRGGYVGEGVINSDPLFVKEPIE